MHLTPEQQAKINGLTAVAFELGLNKLNPMETELRWREARVQFFTRLWENVSAYAEEAAALTVVKGQIPDAAQIAEMYRMQMHAVVCMSITGTMHTNCREFFRPGFLDAAARSSMLDASDLPALSKLDLEMDLDIHVSAERRMGVAMSRALRMIDVVHSGGQGNAVTASKAGHLALTLEPGYSDPRVKGVQYAVDLDALPIRVPAKLFDDVDFLHDMLQGLCAADAGSKMKTEAHAFIAGRCGLNELRLWRANYIARRDK